jgi:hypothetical protein
MSRVALAQGAVRPKNHGRTLPGYLDTQHPEAVRGTTHVRTLDPNLLVAWDPQRAAFVIYGPSLSAGGWVPICVCQDDLGRPFRGVVPWEIICATLRNAREGELSADIAARQNERMLAAADAARRRELEEGARYFARGIAGELEGWGRQDAADISRGWKSRWV